MNDSALLPGRAPNSIGDAFALTARPTAVSLGPTRGVCTPESVAARAERLLGVDCLRASPAENVFLPRHDLHVLRVNAERFSAKVIKLKVDRHVGNEKRVNDPMCGRPYVAPAYVAPTYQDRAISRGPRTAPKPTAGAEFKTRANVFPKFFRKERGKIYRGSHRVLLYGIGDMGRGEGCNPSRPALYSRTNTTRGAQVN